jgi:hypothetical protein
MPNKRFFLRVVFFLILPLLLSPRTFPNDDLPLVLSPSFARPQENEIAADTMRQRVEDDWERSVQPPLTTQADAAGGCDGVKDGKYGFHLGMEAHPWWRIDLGETTPIRKIVVYNRLDYAPGLHNADTLQILYSTDGQDWIACYDNGGVYFGGIEGPNPLEVSFDGPGLSARFIKLCIPSPAPILFHLDEVEIFSVGDDTHNIALGKPADQSSLSRWSKPKIAVSKVYPIASHLDRGRRLISDLQGEGVDVSSLAESLDQAAEELTRLPKDASKEERRALYFKARWIVRRLVFKNPLLDFDRLLFVKRFTQETYPDVCLNHMPWVSKPGGDLCVLAAVSEEEGLFSSLAAPESSQEPVAGLRSLLNRALGPGHIHGMDLWFDGNRVVFGYARARSDAPPEGWLDRMQSYRLRRSEEPIHLFELHLDNGRLEQLTFGEWSDLDPTYAPNGDIVFVSERSGTSLQCNEYDKDETSCNLYVLDAHGGGIRRLSVNKDGDYLPHCLDDGMIAYTRWEYHERSWAYIQSIWVIRPDGTGADAVFKQHFVDPWALEDMRSIPRSNKLVAIAAGHHTLAVGPLVVIDPREGINEPRGIHMVSPNLIPPEGGMDGVPVPEGGTDDLEGFYSTPWALSEKNFLVSYAYGKTTTDPTGYGLYLVDVHGNKELVYRDPDISCFSPTPLRARPKPFILPDTVNLAANYATCYVSDIGYGSEELAPEEIRYLRVAEPIGWPYDNERGGQRYGEDHRYAGEGAERKNLTNWTPIRILGDVPVQADGSVHFRVPPDVAVYFQLLDENRQELRRMRSFISFQPGESRGCVGCHETRAVAPQHSAGVSTVALQKTPDTLILPPWGDRPISFLRDVQPVLDEHCTSCHGGLSPAAGLDFSGGLISYDEEVPGYGHNRAFETILANDLVSLSPARMQDASITPPLAYGSRKSLLITALRDEMHSEHVQLTEEERLRLVIWIDANAPYHDQFVNKRAKTPAYNLAGDKKLRAQLNEIHSKRCTTCHEPDQITRLDWINLNHPDQSLFLTAPLSQAVGGMQKCVQETYATGDDPDYESARRLVSDAVAKAWQHPRRDLQSLDRPTWTFGHSASLR